MSRPAERARATFVGKWLLAVVTPLSAQALGSLQAEALVLMSVLAATACALLWYGATVRASRASRLVVAALGVFVGATILQAVPLPSGLTHFLTPANADIWDRALAPLHEAGPSWHALGVAPAATRIEVLRGFFYACIFLGAVRVAALERGERFLIALVLFSTSLMAVSALGHTALGATHIFGVYAPREIHAYRPEHLAPLLNTNHLAAYLNIGACVALGTLLTRRSIPRALSASAMLVTAATSIWQGSRGATGTLLFGVLLVFGLALYAKPRFDSARAESAILVACALAATAIVGITVSDVARVQLLSQDRTKLDVARSSIRLLTDSPFFGSGRGAFETVFSSVREGAMYVTFTHPEDIVVQWTVEWGLPVSIVGAALLAWALRPRTLLRAVKPAVGVWAAIVVTVLHDLVDYHLEVPGVVALVAVCTAIVVSSRAPSVGSSAPPQRAAAELSWFAGASVVGTAVAIVAMWSTVGHSLAADERRLSAMAIDRNVTGVAFEDALRASMLRYPAEPFFPLMGAIRNQVVDHGNVVPWVGRALERSPHFGRAHFVLARSLGPLHAAQARLEYRLAYEDDERLRDAVVKASVELVTDAATALEVVPDGALGVDMLDQLVVALAPRLPATAVMLDQALERRAPASVMPLRRRADAAVADVTAEEPWCPKASPCVDAAIRVATELSRREPTRCAAHALLARVRIAQGEVDPALEALEAAADQVTDRGECQRQVILLSIAENRPRRAEAALDLLVRSGCGATADCVELYVWAGSMEETREHYVRAVRLYRRALEAAPEREEMLERIGALGNKVGVLPDALEAYRVLAERHPQDPRWPARTAELQPGRAVGGGPHPP